MRTSRRNGRETGYDAIRRSGGGNKNTNNKENNKGGGGGNQPGPNGCLREGQACTQNNDCCGGNCFDFVCTDFVTQCGGNSCGGDARGCANGTWVGTWS